MSGLAELESARRRRLQQAYTDLRPLDKGNDDERPGRGSAAAGGACPPSHLAGVHSGRSGHGAGAAEAVTAAVAAVPPVAAAQFNPFNCDTDDADVALPSDVELALISVKWVAAINIVVVVLGMIIYGICWRTLTFARLLETLLGDCAAQV
ncbi:hypothetical protein Vafri_9090 [Volvox africanus]|uniref:Uncharacterized protein n=1 Tax=Volvox africanus TaxID=51714 RepID=A0A8J4EZF2_9CHLO|nr:hypothetical protein Vafri_9090 [Volvox africanus]